MYLFTFSNQKGEVVARVRATTYAEALYDAGVHPTYTYTQVATP